MSHLRLLKESELRKGNIIGSGAFGTVYKVRDWDIRLDLRLNPSTWAVTVKASLIVLYVLGPFL